MKMLQYANGFTCATDEEGNLILHLTQSSPVVKDGEIQDDVQTEVVSSVIMNNDVAQSLIEVLSELTANHLVDQTLM